MEFLSFLVYLLVSIVLIVGLFWGLLSIAKAYLRKASQQNEGFGHVIRFRKIEDAQRFIEETDLTITYRDEDLVMVQTTLQESELKAYLLETFQLGPGQVIIPSQGVSY
ncbi:hypothetical protein [Streptococcus sp.]|jgi:hypothetical protein|uniref:hypothetical protein n=1 Tax=Streptococcus sp. TaxID=1306 RepID=UPI00391C18F3